MGGPVSILAIDFDLTICSDSRFGSPMPGAVEKLGWLRTRGHRLIVHTAKANTDSGAHAVRGWLDEHHVPYHGIAGKLSADRYIDDKALHFTTWDDVWEQLK